MTLLRNEAPADPDAATAYLQSVAAEDRRATGMVYTPDHLVAFVLDQGGYSASAPIATATLLDPACGSGAFLAAAVVRLAAALSANGVALATRAGGTTLQRAVAAQLFGVDVDARACALARDAVRTALLRVAPRATLPSSFFETNIVEADFLTDDAAAALPVVAAGGFDFIVGNPPYVSTTRIRDTDKVTLRRRFRAAVGRIDLYALFVERAIELLRRGGRLAFITPDKFLASQSARPLRALMLSAGGVRSIAVFGSHKVFDTAATVPCVTVFERGASAGAVEVLECGDRPGPSGGVPVLRRDSLPRSRLTATGWHIERDEWRSLARRLSRGHAVLASCTTRVSAGLATGRDPLFVFTKGAHDLESELLHRAARGRDLQAYRVTDAGLYVLVPYRFDRAGDATLVDLADYPRARAYLQRHRKSLEARHCVRVWGKRWYDVHDPVSFNVGARKKILVPDVASSNRFVLDEGRYWPLHSAYYLLPSGIDPWFLTAVLNSMPIEFLIRLTAPVVKDGFSRSRKQFLMTLPTPAVDRTEAATIATLAADGVTDEANERVGRLFGLTSSDSASIRAYLASRDTRRASRARSEPA